MTPGTALLCTFFCTSAARAEKAVDIAKEAFAQAKELFSEGEYLLASKKFKEAYNAKPTWKLFYNIGHCEAAAKRYGLALEAFEKYLAEAGDEIPLSRHEEVRAEVNRLRDMVGSLKVKTHKGAEIFVDGESRGTAPLYGGIPVAAARQHSVIAVKEGLKIAPVSVRVMGGKTVEVELMAKEETENDKGVKKEKPVAKAEKEGKLKKQSVGKADEIPEEVPQEPPPSVTGQRGAKLEVAGWITTVAGLASLGAGGLTGGLALAKEKKLDDKCEGSLCDDSLLETEEKRDRLGIISTVTFSVGAAATVAGVVMLIAAKKAEKEKLSLLPIAGPKVAGFVISAGF